jgi:membrane protein
MKINLKKSYWLSSTTLHIGILLIYFSLLYRWLFNWRIKFQEAFVASLAFSVSIFLGKSLFWVYMYYVRTSLMRNYGDLYTSVMGVVWLFYLMCFFFYGACICHVYKERRELGLGK